MGLFTKKPKLFGDSVEPSCGYCRFNRGDDDDIVCIHFTADGKICKNYDYDPTLRTPKKAPKLKKYMDDDFSI